MTNKEQVAQAIRDKIESLTYTYMTHHVIVGKGGVMQQSPSSVNRTPPLIVRGALMRKYFFELLGYIHISNEEVRWIHDHLAEINAVKDIDLSHYLLTCEHVEDRIEGIRNLYPALADVLRDVEWFRGIE